MLALKTYEFPSIQLSWISLRCRQLEREETRATEERKAKTKTIKDTHTQMLDRHEKFEKIVSQLCHFVMQNLTGSSDDIAGRLLLQVDYSQAGGTGTPEEDIRIGTDDCQA